MNTDKRMLVMQWYELYYDDIYRFILCMMGDQQCCEDFVHDTFVKAYTSLDRYENRSNVKTWLFSIAKHLVIDEIRKRKRRSLFSLFEKEMPSSINVEQHIENRETINQLIEVINKLKPNYRMVIILKMVQECSTKEIAEILDCSEVKVRKTLSRALQSLRKMKGMEGGEFIEQSF